MQTQFGLPSNEVAWRTFGPCPRVLMGCKVVSPKNFVLLTNNPSVFSGSSSVHTYIILYNPIYIYIHIIYHIYIYIYTYSFWGRIYPLQGLIVRGVPSNNGWMEINVDTKKGPKGLEPSPYKASCMVPFIVARQAISLTRTNISYIYIYIEFIWSFFVLPFIWVYQPYFWIARTAKIYLLPTQIPWVKV